MKFAELLEDHKSKDEELRLEIMSKRDELTRKLSKIMGRVAVVNTFGPPHQRGRDISVTYWLLHRSTPEDDAFFIRMAKIATIAEVQKLFPNFTEMKSVGQHREPGVQPKITFVFKRKSK